jgi:hypothetical protein
MRVGWSSTYDGSITPGVLSPSSSDARLRAEPGCRDTSPLDNPPSSLARRARYAAEGGC